MPDPNPNVSKPTEVRPPKRQRRDRSPNYPAHTIGEAVAKAEAIWRKEKRHPVSLQIAVQHMGLRSATSGSAAPLISSLRKYGLLEVLKGGDVRISDEASPLFVCPATSPEYMTALRRLAMKPSLFGEVLQKFPDGLPSDENLRSRLQLEWKFASREAADAFIRTLRAAVGVGGVDVALPEGEDGGKDTIRKELAMPPAQSIVSPPTPQHPGAPPIVGGAYSLPRQERHAWKLGKGVWAEITITGALTAARLEKLKGYIDLLDAEGEEDRNRDPEGEKQD